MTASVAVTAAAAVADATVVKGESINNAHAEPIHPVTFTSR